MKRAMSMMIVVMLVALWTRTAFADNRFVFSEKTVKDKRTGLIWTRDANLGQLDWNGAFGLVKELNGKKYARFKDWRLPSKDELETLATYAKGLGYDGNTDTRRPYQLFNQMGFYDVQATSSYWTSTTCASSTSSAWSVGMADGLVDSYYKGFDGIYVWPVRGGH